MACHPSSSSTSCIPPPPPLPHKGEEEGPPRTLRKAQLPPLPPPPPPVLAPPHSRAISTKKAMLGSPAQVKSTCRWRMGCGAGYGETTMGRNLNAVLASSSRGVIHVHGCSLLLTCSTLLLIHTCMCTTRRAL